MSRYTELIKKIQLNSLAIYDATNPTVEIVVTLREIIAEMIVRILKKTKYISLQDLSVFENKLREKIKKRIKYDLESLSCYWLGALPVFDDYYDITKNFYINIRIIIQPEKGMILYVPTVVRYCYGEI